MKEKGIGHAHKQTTGNTTTNQSPTSVNEPPLIFLHYPEDPGEGRYDETTFITK